MILKKLTKTLIVAATMITAESYAADFECEALLRECATPLGKDFLKKVQAAKKTCSNAKFTVTIQEKLISVVSNPHYDDKRDKVYIFNGNKGNLAVQVFGASHLPALLNSSDEGLKKQTQNKITKTLNSSNPLKLRPAFKQGKAITIELDPMTFLSKICIFTNVYSKDRRSLPVNHCRSILLKVLDELYKHAPALTRSYDTDQLATVMSICIVAPFNSIIVGSEVTRRICGSRFIFFSNNSGKSKERLKNAIELIKPIKDIVKRHLEKRIKEFHQQRSRQNMLKNKAYSNLIIKAFN